MRQQASRRPLRAHHAYQGPRCASRRGSARTRVANACLMAHGVLREMRRWARSAGVLHAAVDCLKQMLRLTASGEPGRAHMHSSCACMLGSRPVRVCMPGWGTGMHPSLRQCPWGRLAGGHRNACRGTCKQPLHPTPRRPAPASPCRRADTGCQRSAAAGTRLRGVAGASAQGGSNGGHSAALHPSHAARVSQYVLTNCSLGLAYLAPCLPHAQECVAPPPTQLLCSFKPRQALGHANAGSGRCARRRQTRWQACAKRCSQGKLLSMQRQMRHGVAASNTSSRGWQRWQALRQPSQQLWSST